MDAFTKTTAEQIALEIEAAVQAVAQKHGLTIKRAGGKFDSATFDMKLSIKINDVKVQTDQEQRVFNLNCRLFGLDPSDFGREFTVGRKRYKVTGLAIKRRKYPIKCFSYADGKVMLYTEAMVPAIQLARQAQKGA